MEDAMKKAGVDASIIGIIKEQSEGKAKYSEVLSGSFMKYKSLDSVKHQLCC